MKVQKTYLPELQISKLKLLLGSADFQLLRQCIASELAAAEVDLVAVDVWIDDQDMAKSQAKNQRMRAKQYLNALETLDEMNKEKYQFFNAQITIN